MLHRLYVGNLAANTTEGDLHAAFRAAGQAVKGIFLLPDPTSNGHRGFGFIEVDSPAAAEAVILLLDGSLLDGNRVQVSGTG